MRFYLGLTCKLVGVVVQQIVIDSEHYSLLLVPTHASTHVID